MATIKQKLVESKTAKETGGDGMVVDNDQSLTIRQKLFCKYYIETFGNGTEAVIKAGYQVHKKGGRPDGIVAKSIASENLTKPYILKYLNTLLEANGLNDTVVSTHLAFVINQFADLSAKLRGIDIYYKLKGSYSATSDPNSYRREEIDEFLDHIRTILPRSQP